jgi:hypothetical protein
MGFVVLSVVISAAQRADTVVHPHSACIDEEADNRRTTHSVDPVCESNGWKSISTRDARGANEFCM